MSVKLIIRDLDDPERCRVEGTGFDVKAVDEKAAQAFGLLRATGYHPGAWEACRYILGAPPNDMWLGEPTGDQGGGKMYELNAHWKPCQVRRTFKRAQIISLDTTPAVLAAVRHDNSHSSLEATYHAGLESEFADHAEIETWSSLTNGFSLTLGVEVGNEASAVKGKVETTYSMEAASGKNKTKGKSRAFTTEEGVEVTIPAGRVMRSIRYAAFGAAVFDVTYELSLVGDAYAYYKKGLPNIGHHATVDVEELRRIMREVYGKNAPATVEATDRVEIGIFGDSYTSLEDAD